MLTTAKASVRAAWYRFIDSERVPVALICASSARSCLGRRRCLYGNWNRQMVQRREGVRLHHPGGWWEGRLRPPLVDLGRGLQDARRGRARAVRRRRGYEGTRGEERRRRLVPPPARGALTTPARRRLQKRSDGWKGR